MAIRGHLPPEVGASLRDARHRSGRKAREVAADAGISLPHLFHLEGGSRRPSVESAARLATALDLPAEHAELLDAFARAKVLA
jgi:transcriptional regulator with XRE-family HTH domain